MLLCTGQLVTAALFAIFSTDNIRDTSPLLCHRSPSGRHGHIRAPRTWLHHIYVYKKIHTWCRETPGNPSSATAPAGGRHEEGSCTPSPRVLQCQHHTPCPGSLTHTKTPQTWCCQCHFSPWHVPTPRTGSGKEDAVIELSPVRRALGCKWNGGLFFIRYLFCIPYDCFSQHPLV